MIRHLKLLFIFFLTLTLTHLFILLVCKSLGFTPRGAVIVIEFIIAAVSVGFCNDSLGE